MTEAQGWAIVAFLCLALAAAVIVFVAMQILPITNAFGVMHKLDDLFDKRINAVLDRYREQKKKEQPQIPDGKPQAQAGTPFTTAPLIHAGMSAMEDQPDATDVADA
ncbi:MAG: hypothetical protein ABR949_10315 [Candidatus Aquilonibacter sp.]|jgi:hypothetical protein